MISDEDGKPIKFVSVSSQMIGRAEQQHDSTELSARMLTLLSIYFLLHLQFKKVTKARIALNGINVKKNLTV